MNNITHLLIKTCLLTGNGESRSGGLELIEQWQNDKGASIWIDIQQPPHQRKPNY